jgi:hypothetical protein
VIFLAGVVPVVPPLTFSWSNTENFTRTFFSFAWPYLSIALGIAILFWLVGILAAVAVRVYNRIFYGTWEEVDPKEEGETDYHEPDLFEEVWTFLTGRTRNRWYDEHAPGIAHTKKSVNPGFYRLMSLISGEEVNPKGFAKDLFQPGQDILMEAMWLITGSDKYSPNVGVRSEWKRAQDQKWQYEKRKRSIWNFVTTGRVKYLFDRTSYPVKRNLFMAYLTGDDGYMAGNMRSWWLYMATGKRRYWSRKSKPVKPNFFLYMVTGNRKYLKKRVSKPVKPNFFMYMLTGSRKYLKKRASKSVKPSLVMYYMTRNKAYLGRGRLKPSFWPDVVSEGFYLAFGAFFGFDRGRRRQRRRGGKDRGKSHASRGKSAAARRRRVANGRVIRQKAKQTRAKLAQVKAVKKFREGSVDYHAHANIRIKPAARRAMQGADVQFGDFGKYKYKLFSKEGQVTYAHLYGEKGVRVLASVNVWHKEGGGFSVENMTDLYTRREYTDILARIINQAEGHGDKEIRGKRPYFD